MTNLHDSGFGTHLVARGAPLRIAMLSSDYLPNIGGIATHIAGLSWGLQQLGHHVQVIVPRWTFPWRHVGASSQSINGTDVVRLGIPFHPRLKPLYWEFERLWVTRFVRAERIDVIHWHTFEQRAVANLHGPAKVFTNHSSVFLAYRDQISKREQMRAILSPAHVVITPSHELADATVEAGFDRDRTFPLPNGVDTTKFAPNVDGSEVRARLGIAENEILILCARRLVKKNGVIYWVQAIPKLLERVHTSVKFLFVGDYEIRDEYSSRTEVLNAIERLSLGNRVIWTGRIANEEMPAYFAASDIVVLPSLVEATSIAGLEAMASGKPLIGTNVGGIPEILSDNETGILVPPGNSEALANAAAELVNNPSRMHVMGQSARQRVVDKFSWVEIARRTQAIYQKAIEIGSGL